MTFSDERGKYTCYPPLETDADRLDMLRALGGLSGILIEDQPLSIGLFENLPRDVSFDELTVNTTSPVIQCLFSEARRLEVRAQNIVEIPGESDRYFVAKVTNESGMAVIELRKE